MPYLESLLLPYYLRQQIRHLGYINLASRFDLNDFFKKIASRSINGEPPTAISSIQTNDMTLDNLS